MTIEISNQAKLPTIYGDFIVQTFKEGDKEHLAIFTPDILEAYDFEPTVRIHSECLTGDALGSLKCDCGDQLHFALHEIAKKSGMLIYLRQEGRNIGLFNKINAYALQDQGLNTIEANHQLGFAADERSYEIVGTILDYYKISKIKLLTNNPQKLDALSHITITERLPIIIDSNKHNAAYLKIKKDEMGHLL